LIQLNHQNSNKLTIILFLSSLAFIPVLSPKGISDRNRQKVKFKLSKQKLGFSLNFQKLIKKGTKVDNVLLSLNKQILNTFLENN
jgi:hypothetical protein